MKAVIYTSAHCSYCDMAKNLLKKKNIEISEEIKVDQDAQQRQNMLELTKRRTVPQIFIDQQHIGGYDDLVLWLRAFDSDSETV